METFSNKVRSYNFQPKKKLPLTRISINTNKKTFLSDENTFFIQLVLVHTFFFISTTEYNTIIYLVKFRSAKKAKK